MDYVSANAQLTGRCKNSRKIANNTYLQRRGNDDIAVRLHSTDVVTFHKNGDITVSTGGWNTVTTKDRIQRYTPSSWRVWSESGYMFIRTQAGEWNFNGSVRVKANGKANGISAEKARAGIRAARNEARRPAARAGYWIRKARGIFTDTSKCTASRWNCKTRSRWERRRGITEGDKECGCRVYRKVPSSKKLTVDSIMAEENAAVRAAQMSIYGIERFFLDAKPNIVETLGDYSLMDLKLGQWENVKALKMTCPSTGAVYVQTVPPNVGTVSSALDWIFDTEDYLKQVTQSA
jgi:hypothetical protein